MYELVIPGQDLWDEEHERFVVVEPYTLTLRHTLLSLYEWEGRWKIPLLDNKRKKTWEQRLDYIKCMTENAALVPDKVWIAIGPAQMKEVESYLSDRRTATTFAERKNLPGGSKFVTAELIYYWMSTFNIPYYPCQEWNLNRLLTLIKIASEEQKGPQKQSRADVYANNRALNEARKKALGTKG